MAGKGKQKKPQAVVPLKPGIFLFIGAPESGKSYLIRRIMYQYAKEKFFGFGKIYSGTGEINDDYDYLKSHIETWDEEKAKKYVQEIYDMAKKKGNKNIPHNFLVLDDLLGKMKPYSTFLQWVESVHRQLRMSIFITSQCLTRNISTLLRSICNKAFLFPPEDRLSHKCMWEAFGTLYFPKLQSFQQLLKRVGDMKYRCLIFTRGTRGKDINKAWIGFIAKEVPEFTILLD